jgi:hypothetical protein
MVSAVLARFINHECIIALAQSARESKYAVDMTLEQAFFLNKKLIGTPFKLYGLDCDSVDYCSSVKDNSSEDEKSEVEQPPDSKSSVKSSKIGNILLKIQTIFTRFMLILIEL